ncbi:hypothetical protein COV61_01985 [Candidatus Micrarchaeota archaeon CG11_big_fil_rev_8_21_14_0_20_47_5]|nr:MAG: hypothetical protein AUJ17_04535 [Candidatus Micrarchaeota archaeon CG1_02_47_40]PIN83824.1 MAG: hypothetical protein COV61_01985 [Candidatus Micrarchaeota archaeon CG11_big_fil_rev_8_21_14_0_20_47_5]
MDEILLLLLSKRAHKEPLHATTRALAAELGISQQSFSRKAIGLVSCGYIKREGGAYLLTKKAIEEAKSLQKALSDSLFGGARLDFGGRVVRGLGQGKKFLSIPKYKKGVEKELGFSPFPGTLNVNIPPEEIELRLRLKSKNPIIIKGFVQKGKTYGPILAYPALIGECIRGAVIFPDRSVHGLSVMELIAPMDIKKKLRIRDGDSISFSVECEGC